VFRLLYLTVIAAAMIGFPRMGASAKSLMDMPSKRPAGFDVAENNPPPDTWLPTHLWAHRLSQLRKFSIQQSILLCLEFGVTAQGIAHARNFDSREKNP
jgi:hypothetical protein